MLIFADAFQKQVVLATENYLKEQAHEISSALGAERYRVKVYPPQVRIKEPACREIPLVTAVNPLAPGTQSVKVSCLSKSQWTVYVKGQISIYLPVLVSKTNINQGTAFSSTQLAWQERDIGALTKGYFTDPCQLVDKMANRSIKAGTTIIPGLVTQIPSSKYDHEQVIWCWARKSDD